MKKNISKFILIFIIIFICLLCTKEVFAISGKNSMKILESNSLKNKTEEQYISSNVYLTSELYSYIGRILPKTTIEQFKLSFNVEAEKIHIYKNNTDENEINSGYVATDMIVKFDDIDKEYLISVVGDINGDGLANQIDIQKLIKHIVNADKYAITDIPLISADVNNDDSVNQIDLTVLINYVVFGRLNIGEIEKPQKPTIEVVEGEKTEEELYTTEVTIKISPNKEEKVLKTTYTISGTKTVEETEIPEDGLIKLSQDGIYTIKAYTYLKNGAKSPAEQLIINKSSSTIADENIGLTMKLENREGEEYQENTWTNKSVLIETIDTEEEFEGGVKVPISTTYTITGKVTVSIPTNTPILLNDSGEYTITAIATDIIGRTKIKYYKVKIDKEMPTSSTVAFEEEKTEGFYNTAINGTITHGTDTLSGIQKVTYELSEAQIKEETEIENEGAITIEEEGKTILTIRTYDVAGNVKTDSQEIWIDKTAPTDIEITTDNLTGTGFDLLATAKDNISGIKKYEFYLDENLLKTDETSAESSNASATLQESKKHTVRIEVTDVAGNVNQKEIEVTNAKLTSSEIARVEFVITDFNVSNSQTEPDLSKVHKIVSNTSSSSQSKYMQISIDRNSEDYSENRETNGLTGELEGVIKIIRKDGLEVTDLNFFPEELAMEFKYSSEVNGSGAKHNTVVEVCGEKIHTQEGEVSERIEEQQKSLNIKTLVDANKNNYFKITEKKIQGTTSFTRLAISKVSLRGIDLPFDIIDK